MREMRERFVIWLVWKLPKSVVYWSAIRLIVNATEGKYEDQVVNELTTNEALNRWYI